ASLFYLRWGPTPTAYRRSLNSLAASICNVSLNFIFARGATPPPAAARSIGSRRLLQRSAHVDEREACGLCHERVEDSTERRRRNPSASNERSKPRPEHPVHGDEQL